MRKYSSPFEALDVWFRTKIVVRENGCWEWMGCRIWNGYGRIRNGSRPVLAHRRIYEILVGRIPEGMNIDHICKNRPCVNPAHLRVLSPKENILCGNGPTAINHRKTRCVNGHVLEWNGRQRACQICGNKSRRRIYLRMKKSGPKVPKSHCNKGHRFTKANTLHHGGSQHCRKCAKERMERFLAKAHNTR